MLAFACLSFSACKGFIDLFLSTHTIMNCILKNSWIQKSTALGLLFLMGLTQMSHASLLDEVQVYTDDINEVGEWGLELHLNRTPKGNLQASYIGEKVNAGATRLTPEISFGLSRTLEAGLYLPLVQGVDGKMELAGQKWRLKWLPLKAEQNQGWFAGLNTEFSQLKYAFSDSTRSVEVRTILGWKNEDWLLATNPVFGWSVSKGYTHQSPDFNLGLKVAKRWTQDSSFGFEYYNGTGRLNEMQPNALQDRTLYIVWDHEAEPLRFNLGIGKGMNANSDAWTLKSIIEVPF